MGGVTRRFPDLHFAFLEGGVAWAAQLYADMLGHFEKRNSDVVGQFDPRRFDLDLCASCSRVRHRSHRRSARPRRAQRGEGPGLLRPLGTTLGFDDFAESAASTERPRTSSTSSPGSSTSAARPTTRMNALAFDTACLPRGARLNAMFASDIGHWDVPDMRERAPGGLGAGRATASSTRTSSATSPSATWRAC